MRLIWSVAVFVAAVAPFLFAQRGVRVADEIEVQKKLALVIGNAEYPKSELKNPVNDAVAMEGTLKRLGFQVTVLRNADLRRMRAAIDEFAGSLGPGSLGFFYFAGHGLQVNRTNYLLPVDFAATSPDDVPYEAYPADRIKDKLEGSGARLRILVLDACRNNPWKYSRDGVDGLAPMAANAVGTLIAYATGDNNTAADSPADANGLYTKFLMPALLTRGLNLHDAFQKAKEDVNRASKGRQNPTIYENLVGQYYLAASAAAGPGPAVSVPVSAVPVAGADAKLWALIETSKDPEDFDSFAAAYPNSEYAPGARVMAGRLRRAAADAARVEAPRIEAPKPAAGLAAGTRRVNPKDGLPYVWVPAGRFRIGCSEGDSECHPDEKPAHEVRISKGFWMGQTEVTVEAYKRFVRAAGRSMPEEPVYVDKKLNPGWSNDGVPMTMVTWTDGRDYCEWAGMRLPTEAEWEYAARGGTSGSRYGKIDSVAWYGDNAGNQRLDSAAIMKDDRTNYGKRIAENGNRPHAAGQKDRNGFGLYDMLGNVMEWTGDWYKESYYRESGEDDPQGPSEGEARVLRGGSWGFRAGLVRVSGRLRLRPSFRAPSNGFRCSGEIPIR